ncbi:MAG: FtsQ-type POTRA domain-containing protein [Pseudomonadota bacterium]|nr:FtsQ-type POTRA domain-containing protein [Pseudomonadota bacterium]
MPKKFYIILIVISIFSVYKLDMLNYPIDEVDINTNDVNYNQQRIDNLISTIYGKDLISLDISNIQKYIVEDIWIKDAEISKSFPSTIKIKIIQHQPFAIYNSKLMMRDGSIIKSDNISYELPVVEDNANNVSNSRRILTISTENLNKIDLKIKRIEIFNSLVRIHTSKYTLISDRLNLELNLNRLALSLNDLVEAFDQEINSIDMRYSNGFAIK